MKRILDRLLMTIAILAIVLSAFTSVFLASAECEKSKTCPITDASLYRTVIMTPFYKWLEGIHK